MWDDEDWGLSASKCIFPAGSALYRSTSTPYGIVGLLVEKRVGVARVFVNAENLTDVRQTNSLIRPDRGVDGRWTVDA